MVECQLARARLQLGDPIGQLGCRIEPGGLRDALEVHHRPEIAAPQRQKLEATRECGVAVMNDVATPLGEIFDLQIGANQDRRIVVLKTIRVIR